MAGAAKKFNAKLGGDAGEVPLIELPFDVKAEFGRARAPVKVTVNGYTFATTVAVYGGVSNVGLRKSHREAAGVEIGETVNVTIEPDTSERTVDVPKELAAAFKKDKAAKAAWGKLSFTHQREHAEAIEEAKKPETRARRVEKALEMLKKARK